LPAWLSVACAARIWLYSASVETSSVVDPSFVLRSNYLGLLGIAIAFGALGAIVGHELRSDSSRARAEISRLDQSPTTGVEWQAREISLLRTEQVRMEVKRTLGRIPAIVILPFRRDAIRIEARARTSEAAVARVGAWTQAWVRAKRQQVRAAITAAIAVDEAKMQRLEASGAERDEALTERLERLREQWEHPPLGARISELRATERHAPVWEAILAGCLGAMVVVGAVYLAARASDASKSFSLWPSVTLAGALAAAMGFAMAIAPDRDDRLKLAVLGVTAIAYVAALRRPRILLALLLGLAPLNVLFAGGGHVLQSTNLLLIGAALGLLRWIRLTAAPVWLVIGVGLLVVGSLLAMAAGEGSVVTPMWGSLRWLALGVVLLVAIRHARGARDLSAWAAISSATLIVVCLGAGAQRVGYFDVVGPPYFASRLDSFLGYYTVLGGYLAIGVVVAVAGLVHAWPTRLALLHGAAVLAGTTATVATLSRGGAASAAVGLVCLALLSLSMRRAAIVVGGSVLVVAAALAVAQPIGVVGQFNDRVVTSISSGESDTNSGSDRIRFEAQRLGYELLSENPLGIGYGRFSSYAEERTDTTLFHSHQVFPQVGLEAGWIGLVGFLLVFGGPIVLALRDRLAGPLPPLAGAAPAALLGAGFQGLFDYLFQETAWSVVMVGLVWATVASHAVFGRRHAEQPASRWVEQATKQPALDRSRLRRRAGTSGTDGSVHPQRGVLTDG
jgi:O-antigen ligase